MSQWSTSFEPKGEHEGAAKHLAANLLGRYGSPGVTPLQAPSDTGATIDASTEPSITYVHGGDIWRFDLLTDRARRITNLYRPGLDAFSYGAKTGKYLLMFRAPSNGVKSDVCPNVFFRWAEFIMCHWRWLNLFWILPFFVLWRVSRKHQPQLENN